ncbi:MAG: PepSY-associated TM helix domain-containing protein [Planctomycetes bacterium]|nr:PepSY-associated TM helix domain-containing protein [Planctomycetota bacterium]
MARIPWRRWNRAIHRDIGYLSVGLLIVYAVSGIAVNHIHEWNPNYRFERLSSDIGPVPHSVPATDDEAREVLRRLELPLRFKTTFQPDPATLKIFQDGNTISANLESGQVTQELVTERLVLYETNFLHLNHPKKLWTWVADAFAVALILLGVTGLFILKGKKGITGRGAWLTTAGFLIPAAFLLLYR